MSATDARKNWFKLIDQAGKPGSVIAIKHRDLPDVVLMSAEEFEGWIETMEIMADSKLMKDIRNGLKDKKAIAWEDVKAELDL
jgi:prevent-host-death family protein